eukprot:1092913-Prymnesium_polylepis.2
MLCACPRWTACSGGALSGYTVPCSRVQFKERGGHLRSVLVLNVDQRTVEGGRTTPHGRHAEERLHLDILCFEKPLRVTGVAVLLAPQEAADDRCGLPDETAGAEHFPGQADELHVLGQSSKEVRDSGVWGAGVDELVE